jgi:pimeloyl-ACP methyl ester carboxylesterase
MPLGILLIVLLILSCLSTGIFKQQDGVLAQKYIQTVKYRNLVIDLGNGVKTNAQLTLPDIGKGPFPGILLISGSGAQDKNGTVGPVHKNGPEPFTPYLQIARYLSERGFAVLRYDKRGIGTNLTIDHKIWGNSTINDLINDAKKAIAVLAVQPEVDPTRISIIGHSQGTIIAPRVAIDNSTKVKNIVLMGIVASSIRDLIYLQRVSLPLEYIEKVLDKNHTGLVSIQQISNNPVLRLLLIPSSIALTFLRTNDTNVIRDGLEKIFANKTNVAGYISIEHQIKPLLIKRYENLSSFSSSKCNMVEYCPIYYRALFSSLPNLRIIGNVSKSTGILLLNGENDSLTPVEQAFLLQQKLTAVNHPDHILITYPNLGHLFYPSSRWMTTYGPIQQYVLADLYAWLEAHSGLSQSYFKPTSASTNISNTSSLNTNKTL